MLVYFSHNIFSPSSRKEALYWGLSRLFELPIFGLAVVAYSLLTNDLTSYLPSPYPLIVATIVLLGLNLMVLVSVGGLKKRTEKGN